MSLQTNMIPKFDNDRKILLDPYRRFDAIILADVTKGVFNGNPDSSGDQRVDAYTGHGTATDVCAKRIIRDTMSFLLDNGYQVPAVKEKSDYEYKLFMQHRGILNDNIAGVYKACNLQGRQASETALSDAAIAKLVVDNQPIELPGVFGSAYAIVQKEDKWVMTFDGSQDARERKAVEDESGKLGKEVKSVVTKLHKDSKVRTITDANLTTLTAELCRQYVDVRWFGAVASTGDKCDNVKGPLQFTEGLTFDPIEPQERCITRSSITRSEDEGRKRQEMGRKKPVPYALFQFELFYNAPLARKIAGGKGVTSEDLKLFWTCVYNFGRFTPSAMRGHCEVAGVYVFAHSHPLGNAHAHQLFSRLHVSRKDGVEHPRSFNDYSVGIDAGNLPDGVQLVKLYERQAKTTVWTDKVGAA